MEIKEQILKEGLRILLSDFNLHTSFGLFKIPKGSIYNGASIPRIFHWFISPNDPKIMIASLIHDMCYIHKLLNFKESNQVFLEIMKEQGLSFLKRQICFRAVNGRIGQDHYTKANKEHNQFIFPTLTENIIYED